jgi:hypothetical protein
VGGGRIPARQIVLICARQEFFVPVTHAMQEMCQWVACRPHGRLASGRAVLRVPK